MRVVILKNKARRLGGLERYTQRLIEAFSRNHEVTLLTTEATAHYPCKQVAFRQGLYPKWMRISHFDKCAQQWIESYKPDIIFGMEHNRFQTHYRAGNGVHAAYLDRRIQREGLWKKASFKINTLHRTLCAIEKSAVEHPRLQRLFVNSQMVSEELLRYYRVDPQKIVVVHNGVDWEERIATPQNARYHFLFVGHDFKRKGLEALLYGLRDLRDYELTIVGHDRRQRLYEALAKRLSISARFVGPQSNMQPFYEAADCLVLPTLYDPFASVTLEALAHGLFVVTSEHNGAKEILTPASGIIANQLDLALFQAQHYQRDPLAIRNSVQHLTFENQLTKIIDQC